MSLLQIFALGSVLSSIALILNIVSVSTTQWIAEDVLDPDGRKVVHIHFGIFRFCPDGIPCQQITNPTSTIQAVRALEIIGIITSACGIALTVAYLLLTRPGKSNMPFHRFGALAQLFGGLCMTIGMTVFRFRAEAGLNSQVLILQWDFGFSFYLCLAASTVAMLGGLIASPASRRMGAEQDAASGPLVVNNKC